ncbi:hypothetical protein SAMN04515695_3310 [Pseudovibrio sp. Tun.PSC04-5.I4]|nr:hypothetical protein SAMN04515695_3310 [Pseudovibrio sp. Tun.PSC04-5.I4]
MKRSRHADFTKPQTKSTCRPNPKPTGRLLHQLRQRLPTPILCGGNSHSRVDATDVVCVGEGKLATNVIPHLMLYWRPEIEAQRLRHHRTQTSRFSADKCQPPGMAGRTASRRTTPCQCWMYSLQKRWLKIPHFFSFDFCLKGHAPSNKSWPNSPLRSCWKEGVWRSGQSREDRNDP